MSNKKMNEAEVRFQATIWTTIANFIVEIIKNYNIKTIGELLEVLMEKNNQWLEKLDEFNSGEEGDIQVEVGEWEGK